jgi:YidC/Oxa1 family membrane protein insertase
VTGRAAAKGAQPQRGAGNFGPMLIIMGAGVAIFFTLAAGQDPWNLLFITPLVNSLVLLNNIFGNFGIAILLFTLLLRLATLPFTIRQLQSTKEMQAAQPKMQEIQKKYKDPKRRQEEMLKLYREHNINPLGCVMPLVIQMVVFIALFRALVFLVGGSPESLIGLSQKLYPWSYLSGEVPLNQSFLWLKLGEPDTTFALPLLVGASTYVQQKLSQTPSTNVQAQQQQQMMMWMMPLFMVFITMNLASGVGVYWVASNIFSLFASYFVYGRRVSWRQVLLPGPAPAPSAKQRAQEKPTKTEKTETHEGEDGDLDEDEGNAESQMRETVESEEPTPTTPQRKRARGTHGRRRGRRKDRR